MMDPGMMFWRPRRRVLVAWQYRCRADGACRLSANGGSGTGWAACRAGIRPRRHTADDERMHVEDTFDCSVEQGDGYTVVAVAGEVDVATAPTLRERLDETIGQSGSLVVVDLGGVTFIDSTALGVLIGALNRSAAEGGVLRLVISEPRIIKIFEITGLTELFDIRSSRQEAIAG